MAPSLASLVARITSLWSRQQASLPTTSDPFAILPPAQAARLSATTVGIGGPGEFYKRFSAETERTRVVELCRQMYKTDTRAKGIIQTLARDAVKGGFSLTVKNNAKAQSVADALIKRLHLMKRIDDWARLTFKDGDSFLEVGINAQMEIAKVTRKPTLQMRRNSNKVDAFDDPARAYWFTTAQWQMQPEADTLWFADWQIIHSRYDHDEGDRYGTPLLATSIGPFKRMTEGEIDISVRRKTRAGMKYLHVVEGAGETDLEAYKENNKDALDNPMAAVADFFTNKPGSITAIQGDARLADIKDVLHHINTFFIGGVVPMELLGYGEELNRDVLGEKKDEYDRALEQVTEWIEDQLVRPLLERQWLFAGILPEGLDYELKWKSKQALTAESLGKLADALVRLKALNMPPELIVSLLEQFLPGIDLSQMLTALADDGQRTANAADDLMKDDPKDDPEDNPKADDQPRLGGAAR